MYTYGEFWNALNMFLDTATRHIIVGVGKECVACTDGRAVFVFPLFGAESKSTGWIEANFYCERKRARVCSNSSSCRIIVEDNDVTVAYRGEEWRAPRSNNSLFKDAVRSFWRKSIDRPVSLTLSSTDLKYLRQIARIDDNAYLYAHSNGLLLFNAGHVSGFILGSVVTENSENVIQRHIKPLLSDL